MKRSENRSPRRPMPVSARPSSHACAARRLLGVLLAALLLAGGIVRCPASAEEGGVTLPDRIPEAASAWRARAGTVELITYPSHDWLNGGKAIEKNAVLYLPPGYSPEEKYDLLVLCHGSGGDETEWGFMKPECEARNAVEYLISTGRIRPLIIVMPNGRATERCYVTGADGARAFYVFGQELRNDLLPYIDANWSTWGDREHRSIAGLSMGAMQAVNIGLCECLDLFSAFGAFSAPRVTYPAEEIAEKLEAFPEEDGVRCFYSICGTSDTSAYDSATAAVRDLPLKCPRFSQENLIWFERRGGHNFEIWNLGLYHFLLLTDAAE